MDKYFISLDPSKELYDRINEQKTTIKNIIGEQKYLIHPPHITLILFSTHDIEKAKKAFEIFSPKISKINIKIEDIDVYYNDKLTNGHTIIYNLSESDVKKLREVQMKVNEFIMPLNTKEIILKNSVEYNRLSDNEKENVDKYGYPYFGKNWVPHLTLASIEKDKFGDIFELIKSQVIRGLFTLDSISLYKVAEPSILIRRGVLKDEI